MSEQEKSLVHEISITLKGGTGFDSPWIVVRTQGETPQEAVDKAAEAVKHLLDNGVYEGVQSHAAEFIKSGDPYRTGGSERPSAAGSGPSGGTPGRVPGTGDGPGLSCPTCGGPTIWKTGTSSNGRPYKGWFCADPNSRGHTVQWK